MSYLAAALEQRCERGSVPDACVAHIGADGVAEAQVRLR